MALSVSSQRVPRDNQQHLRRGENGSMYCVCTHARGDPRELSVSLLFFIWNLVGRSATSVSPPHPAWARSLCRSFSGSPRRFRTATPLAALWYFFFLPLLSVFVAEKKRNSC